MDRGEFPAVLGMKPEVVRYGSRDCHCFCTARHPLRVCRGRVSAGEVGVRVWFNSLYTPPEGVFVCQPCAEDYAEYPEHTVR